MTVGPEIEAEGLHASFSTSVPEDKNTGLRDCLKAPAANRLGILILLRGCTEHETRRSSQIRRVRDLYTDAETAAGVDRFRSMS